MPPSPDQAGAQSTGDTAASFVDDPTAGLLLALDSLDGNPATQLLLSTLGHTRDAVVLRGHRREVLSAKLDPTGGLAVTGSLDHQVAVWDTTNGEQKAVFDIQVPPRFRPHGPEFDATGELIIINGVDGLVRIVPWRQNTLPPPLPVSGRSVTRTATAAGKLLLGHADGTVSLVRLEQPDDRPLVLIKDPTAVPIVSVAISHDGLAAAAANQDGRMWLLHLEAGRPRVLSGHDGHVNKLAFRPDGEQLASASDDATVKLHAVPDGHLEMTLRTHDDRVNDVVYNHDGTRLVTACVDRSAGVHDTLTGKLLAVLHGAVDELQQVAISPDSHLVATASTDGKCRVHYAHNGSLLFELPHANVVNSVEFAAHGRTLITSCFDRTARVWDIHTGKVILHPKEVNTVAFSHDRENLVTTCEDGRTRVFEVRTGKELAVEAEQEGAANCAVFSPDGTLLAIACQDGKARVVPWKGGGPSIIVPETLEVDSVAFDGTGGFLVTSTRRQLGLWRLENLERVATMGPSAEERATNPFVAIIWADVSKDGKWAASGHYDQEARVYNAATGVETGRLDTGGIAYTVAFGDDRKTLIVASGDGTARLFDAEDLRLTHLLVGPSSQLRSAALSGTGKLAVVGGADGLVTVFDVPNERVLTVRKLHADAVMSVAFCGEKQVASAGDVGTVKLLDLEQTPSLEQLMASARERARPATAGE
jgi:WD40 repeat protein